MKIKEVIDKMINYHSGQKLDSDMKRDQILFGNEFSNKECTGIVTTTWANIDVIKTAIKRGANLIICHEALFWNHGDHTDWLTANKNKTFALKKQLLEDNQIVVWRDHDHIHFGGIPVKDQYFDGIFYGFAQEMGWAEYATGGVKGTAGYLRAKYREYQIPQTTVASVAQKLMAKGDLNGCKIFGDPLTPVSKVLIPTHNLGDAKELITKIDQENFDLVLGLEVIDFTLSEYIRDSNMLGLNKALLTIGHFNLEEFGVKYMMNYLPQIFANQIPCSFVKAGDSYNYLLNKNK